MTLPRHGRDEVGYDAVLVGASAGSLLAALTLAKAGLRPLVVEKSSLVGGGTAYSGGIVWAPANHRMRAKGSDDSLAAGATYLEAIDPEHHDPAVAEVYLTTLPGLLVEIEKWTGLTWVTYTGLPDYWSELPGGTESGRFLLPLPWTPPADGHTSVLDLVRPAAHAVGQETEWIWGRAVVGALVLAAEAEGVDIVLDTAAVDLALGEGPAGTCVVLDGTSGRRRIDPRLGVLMNSGGCEWNRDLVTAYVAGPYPEPQTPADNTGDGHMMGARAGLALANMDQTIAIPGVLVGDKVGDAGPHCRIFFQPLAKPHSVVVDGRGRRFANETFFPDLAAAMARVDQESGTTSNPAYFVFDEEYVGSYGMPPGVGTDVDMVSADSLAGLAGLLRLPVQSFVDEIEDFNEVVRAGAPDAFGRGGSRYQRVFGDPATVPNPTMGTIEAGPFHAIELRLTTSGHRGGFPVDPWGRVLGSDGAVVDGLYACGNIAATGLTGHTYFSGTSLGHALVLASTAAADMIARSRKRLR